MNSKRQVKCQTKNLELVESHHASRASFCLLVGRKEEEEAPPESHHAFEAATALACTQALRALWRRGGKRKDSLLLRLWNLNICIEKVDAKCWLAEMTLVMTSLLLARVFQCLFTFALISASRWLAEIWQYSRRGAAGEMGVEFKFQRRSCKLSLLFSPRHQSILDTLLAGYRSLDFWTLVNLVFSRQTGFSSVSIRLLMSRWS